MTENSSEALRNILFQDYAQQAIDAEKNATRFVHYTTAEVGLSIIKNKNVWLRNSSCMNDSNEIMHGVRHMERFLNHTMSSSLWASLNSIHPDFESEFKTTFNKWQNDIVSRTYMICVSEHDRSEDLYGRLSMWRAYGGNHGVALVIKPDAFYQISDALGAYSYPVIYENTDKIVARLGKFSNDLINNEALTSKISRDELRELLFHIFHTWSLCLKHPAFKEEREWRIVHRPSFGHKTPISLTTQTVNGTPQEVYHLPLEDIEGSVSLAPKDLIEKIIIGPCAHPRVINDAFVRELANAGADNPKEKVVYSNIPLRV